MKLKDRHYLQQQIKSHYVCTVANTTDMLYRGIKNYTSVNGQKVKKILRIRVQ